MPRSLLVFRRASFEENISRGGYFQAPFIWSRVPETTLPLSYPGRGNVYLISFQNSINRLHYEHELVSGGETTRVGELSHHNR